MYRHPQIRAWNLLPGELVVDNFAGGGGASTGIEAAIGRPVDIAVNHSPQAIAMHKANHPETKHYCEDIWQVDPREACGTRPVGLAWFSPDCFPAGTMVLTRTGYRPIEGVVEGDEVLTHKLRWRRVTSTMTTTKPLVQVRGHGHPGLSVSAEHPFLARRRKDVWDNSIRRYKRRLEGEKWVQASDLGRGAYWGAPVEFPEATPPPIPVHRRRTTTIDERLMWLVGLYLADGWTRLTDTRAELVITCGMHDVDRLRERLGEWGRSGSRSGSDEFSWNERKTSTAYQFTANHRGLVKWLREHFGHGADQKRIPGWALGMQAELRRSLLNGYLSGDGYRGTKQGSPLVMAQTVSKALAFGTKAIATSLGYSPTVYLNEHPNTVIEGRKVNAKPAWSVRWRDPVAPAHSQTERVDGIEWAPVREVKNTETTDTVFNLSVEDDESFVADGIIVHNCTHFSRAKGTTPVKKSIRGLAWVVTRWAETVKPRVIILENVEEFATWGPVVDGRPDPTRKGETFRAWLGRLSDLGYTVEFKSLVAADYGTPTTRKRLFLIARRDGAAARWPEATHGDGRAPWRPAAEVIDWSLPCPSIFTRKRPLAEATMRRIATGIRRYVLQSANPFIISHYGKSVGRAVDCPMPTVTAGGGGHHGIVEPLLMKYHGGGEWRGHTTGEPLRTVDTSNRFALLSPFVVRHGHYSTRTGAGLREGCGAGTFRGQRLADPLATVCATNDKHLVCPVILKYYGGVVGHRVDDRPLGTVTSWDHHAIAAAFLTKFYGTSTGADVRHPLPTVTSGGGHLAEVRAFLQGYGGVGPSFEIDGERYVIADIGMRMLQPPELFAAQGFPTDYEIAPEYNGKPLTKTAQTALAGNSVCPPVAEALVASNIGGMAA